MTTSVVDPDSDGSVLIRLVWILIRFQRSRMASKKLKIMIFFFCLELLSSLGRVEFSVVDPFSLKTDPDPVLLANQYTDPDPDFFMNRKILILIFKRNFLLILYFF